MCPGKPADAAGELIDFLHCVAEEHSGTIDSRYTHALPVGWEGACTSYREVHIA
jgi:hypothetical protein